MIRFIAGVIVGALGGLYFLGIFLSSSTESTGGGYVTFTWPGPESPLT